MTGFNEITDDFAATSARVVEATVAAIEMYGGDRDKARRFMTAPHLYLAGDTPAARAARSPQGLTEVLDQMGRAQYV